MNNKKFNKKKPTSPKNVSPKPIEKVEPVLDNQPKNWASKNPIKSCVFTTLLGLIVGTIYSAFFETPFSKFVNNNIWDRPRLEATLSHDGYTRSTLTVQDEKDGTIYKIYPLNLELTNTGNVKFTIKSVIPYNVENYRNPNSPKIDVLYKKNITNYPNQILPGETVRLNPNAYLKESFFMAGYTFPSGHTLNIVTEVEILGSNKIFKLAKVHSLQLDSKGIEQPINNKEPVEFKEVDSKLINW